MSSGISPRPDNERRCIGEGKSLSSELIACISWKNSEELLEAITEKCNWRARRLARVKGLVWRANFINFSSTENRDELEMRKFSLTREIASMKRNSSSKSFDTRKEAAGWEDCTGSLCQPNAIHAVWGGLKFVEITVEEC